MKDNKFIRFVKRNNVTVGIVVFLIVISAGSYRGFVFAAKINSHSELVYGLIYSKSQDHYSYKFWFGNEMYEGNLSNEHRNVHSVGDTLVIQFYFENPNYHIVHSKKSSNDLSKVIKRKVKFWDAW